MSTTAVTRRPNRGLQALIWVAFAVVLAVAFGAAGYTGGPSAGASVTAGALPADLTGLAAPSAVPAAGGVDAASSQLIVDTYSKGQKDPMSLLPAYRWMGAMDMGNFLGITDKINGAGIGSMVGELLFNIASLLWWLLLMLVRYALSVDLVDAAASGIDGQFSQVASGLGKAGIPVLIGAVALLLALKRVLRGKSSQALSVALGAVIVLGSLSFMAGAASKNSGGTAPGSPSYIAVKGNEMVNTAAGHITTAFGAMDGATAKVRSGMFTAKGDVGGATCQYYVQRLYATYDALGNTSDQSTPKVARSALSMVSFMWQRGMYDQYTSARFGSMADGSRIVCHELEHNAKVDPLEQFALVGGQGVNGTVKGGPYDKMRYGPFLRKTNADEHDHAAVFAWAACGAYNQPARPGWLQAAWDGDASASTEQCKAWWTYPNAAEAQKLEKNGAGSLESGATGINKGTGDDVLMWDDAEEVREATISRGGSAAETAALTEVQNVVLGYYGHNGGSRMMSGMIALGSAGLYLYAFGMAAIGTIITQIGLLFLLALLPYTLVALAMPSRDGGRNPMGVKLLKMTGAMSLGKLVFIGVLGASIQLTAMLFNITLGLSGASAAGDSVLAAEAGGVGGGYAFWSMLIPVATIFIMRQGTKTLGLGNMMSLSGAAGLATSASLRASGNDGKRAAAQFQGSLSNNPAMKALGGAESALIGGGRRLAGLPKRGLEKAGERRDEGMHQTLLNETLPAAVAAGALSPALAGEVAAGKMTFQNATAMHTALQAGVPKSLAEAVGRGDITLDQAMAMFNAGKHRAGTPTDGGADTGASSGGAGSAGSATDADADPDLGPDLGGAAGAQARTTGSAVVATQPAFASSSFAPSADHATVRNAVLEPTAIFTGSSKDSGSADYHRMGEDLLSGLVGALQDATRSVDVNVDVDLRGALGDLSRGVSRAAAEGFASIADAGDGLAATARRMESHTQRSEQLTDDMASSLGEVGGQGRGGTDRVNRDIAQALRSRTEPKETR